MIKVTIYFKKKTHLNVFYTWLSKYNSETSKREQQEDKNYQA